ncbi:sensor histidine kinase [Paenibacillus albus]|uniref:Sensor histidine kinase n=1 Tax=Paenibacillus albus TaxID=2495582 RepID=A0A3Q8X7P6_9BACL|nr:sensor histidine kinase [Paenibacillus albus]AZN42463.1 sensor histidine kinase [Paenibacillus albus]
MRWFTRSSKLPAVGVKVFLIYVASMLIIITVMGSLFYYRSTKMMEDKFGGMALQNAQQVGKRLDNLLQDYEDRSLLIVGNKDIQKQLSGKYQSELERIQINDANTAFLSNWVNSRNDVSNIYLLGEKGSSYRYSPKDSFPVYNSYSNEYQDEDWYKQIREANGQVVYFGIRPSFINWSSKLVFCFGRIEKNFSKRGEVLGVLLYEIDPAEIKGMLSEIDYNGSGSNVIVDNKGQIVGDQDGMRLSSNLGFKLTGTDQGIMKNTMNGERMLVVYNKLETNNWTLIGMLRRQDLMKETTDIKWFMLSLGVVFFSIGILFAVIIASTVHRPLKKMIQAMNKAKTGNFDVQIEDKRKDEFGYMYIHFNEMVSRIKELINQLYVQKLLEQGLQLKILGSQINAHFLYNTLDSIHWLARIHKVNDISTMIFGLSKYFRLSLSEGRDEVNVSQIVQLLDSYMTIQNVRYKDKFSLHMHVDPSLEGYKVLKYIFQPLVENAIYHGLEKKRGKGRLDVAFTREGECLKFIVTDDGAGIGPDKLIELRHLLSGEGAKEHHRHFGLRNIHSQIQIAYGMKYGLEINSHLGKGTKVAMTIPLMA